MKNIKDHIYAQKFSVRTENLLLKHGIEFIQDIKKRNNVRSLHYLGPKTYEEIKKYI